MSYLLDTDICIYALNGGSPQLEKMFRKQSHSRLGVSVFTEAELHYGALHSSRPQKNLERIRDFLMPLQKISFDSSAAETFARIKQVLVAKGKAIGVMDMLIAAIAVNEGWTLVSNNTKHFKSVPGLSLENWNI